MQVQHGNPCKFSMASSHDRAWKPVVPALWQLLRSLRVCLGLDSVQALAAKPASGAEISDVSKLSAALLGFVVAAGCAVVSSYFDVDGQSLVQATEQVALAAA